MLSSVILFSRDSLPVSILGSRDLFAIPTPRAQGVFIKIRVARGDHRIAPYHDEGRQTPPTAEGDEADGSLLGPPPANSWERRNAPVAWPAVCEDPGGQTGDLLLFYGTTQDATGLSACGLARSSNGVTWRRATPASPL